MRDPTGQEDEAARTELEFLVPAHEHVVALEDVEHLVLTGVHMRGGVEKRRHFFQGGEGAAGAVGCRSDDDGGLTEDQPLSLVGGEGKRGYGRRCHSGTLRRPPAPGSTSAADLLSMRAERSGLHDGWGGKPRRRGRPNRPGS